MEKLTIIAIKIAIIILTIIAIKIIFFHPLMEGQIPQNKPLLRIHLRSKYFLFEPLL